MSAVYRPRQYGRLTDDEAQRYGERIAKLEEQNRDCQDFPAVMIKDARNEASPLHDWYEWDDSRASDLYRRHQTQMLLCSIEVEIINPHSETEEFTRAFQPVKITVDPATDDEESEPETIGTWTTIQRVLENPEWRKQLVGKALRELESWQKRYRQYHELSSIFQIIDQTRSDYQPGLVK